MKGPGYYLLRGFMVCLGSLPLKFNYFVGRCISWILEHPVNYRRNVIVTNIARSFPDKTYGEISRITHEFYVHLGMIIAETVWAGAGHRMRFHRSGIFTITNMEELARLRSLGRSVMVLTGHAGNWELTGGIMYADSLGKPFAFGEEDMNVTYKKVKNRIWDEVMYANRSAMLDHQDSCRPMLESREVLRYVMDHKDEQKVYLFIADQYPYKGAAGMDVEFMHQPTRTMYAAGRLAARYGMPVAYLSVRRARRGHYDYTFKTITEDASGMGLEEIYDKFYTMLQEDIEALPCIYLWSHKRWKKR